MAKTVIQCDFDGTVTYKDISFLLLDAFAGPQWREYLEQYQDGRITVGRFNELAFSMVKAGRKVMLDYIGSRFRARPGFKNLVELCRRKDYRFVVVSNGLDFYVGEILDRLGLAGTEYHAAQTIFDPAGMKVRYVAPDGTVVERDFKDSYVSLFLDQGDRVAYVGNGTSDFVPASRCQLVFATDGLLEHCKKHSLPHVPFATFNDIAKSMETW